MAPPSTPFRVLVAIPAADVRRAVVAGLEARYELLTASSPTEVADAVEAGVDCLVCGTDSPDGGVSSLLDLATEREIPVVAFTADPGRDLVRRASRTDHVDLVFRVPPGSPDAGPGTTTSLVDETREVADTPVATLQERVEAVYRESISDISDTILDASRSLMGAAVDELDTKIEWELQTVGGRLDADHCVYYQVDDAVLERTHGWNGPRTDDSLDGTVEADRFPGFDDSLSQFDSVVIPSSDRATEAVGIRDTDPTTPTNDHTDPTTPTNDHTDPAKPRNGDTDPTTPTNGDMDPTTPTNGDMDPTTPTASTDDGFEVPSGFVGDVEEILGDESIGSSDRGAVVDGAGQSPFLEDHGLRSFLAVPVVIEWELDGVLAVGRSGAREWSDDIERQLRALGELIGHSLRRRRRRDELERQNERLERFASVVSHDLQNPLNVITGYTQLVLDGGDRENLTEVLASANRMERLVEDLLALAREGAAVSEPEPVDVETVAEAAWRSVETDGATLSVEGGRVVEADRSRLQQLFENLFNNAIEHGGETVAVTVESTGDGFAVEDDGTGIPEGDHEHIFTEGVTGGDGTGLGLSIVQSIVDGHDWSIRATDGRDGGARFEIVVE